ncbi:hypothetical protein [uncultured Victivallis sp.]|uniref:hypothetical protein n=1 Tax=uncultured Victivallis sp. TaxID=354118 RepID=UPI0025CF2524|nr:hypothetical protein [uncultured Victivallis sp.]
MKLSHCFLLAAAGIVLMQTAGCVREVEKREELGVGVVAELPEYPQLARYKLSLQLVGSRTLTAGRPGRVTFSLRNTDDRPLRLVEWYANEPDNLLIYCQPWLPGTTEPDEGLWIPLSFDVKRPATRYPLEIVPGNNVLVTKELPFVEKLVVSPEGERRYFIKAVLNLHSVSAESPVAAIAVESPQRAALREKEEK